MEAGTRILINDKWGRTLKGTVIGEDGNAWLLETRPFNPPDTDVRTLYPKSAEAPTIITEEEFNKTPWVKNNW